MTNAVLNAIASSLTSSPSPSGPSLSKKVPTSWSHTFLDFVNKSLVDLLKEEDVPIKVELLEVDFPTNPENGKLL